MQVEAGRATPAPPVGPALAQHGINIADFCQKFNDATRDKAGTKVPAEVKIFEDGTYEFRIKKPPASELLRKAAGIEKGSGESKKRKVGKVTKEQLKEIAKEKMEDLNTDDIEKAEKIIMGTAKQMGIEIE